MSKLELKGFRSHWAQLRATVATRDSEMDFKLYDSV